MPDGFRAASRRRAAERRRVHARRRLAELIAMRRADRAEEPSNRLLSRPER